MPSHAILFNPPLNHFNCDCNLHEPRELCSKAKNLTISHKMLLMVFLIYPFDSTSAFWNQKKSQKKWKTNTSSIRMYVCNCKVFHLMIFVMHGITVTVISRPSNEANVNSRVFALVTINLLHLSSLEFFLTFGSRNILLWMHNIAFARKIFTEI